MSEGNHRKAARGRGAVTWRDGCPWERGTTPGGGILSGTGQVVETDASAVVGRRHRPQEPPNRGGGVWGRPVWADVPAAAGGTPATEGNLLARTDALMGDRPPKSRWSRAVEEKP